MDYLGSIVAAVLAPASDVQPVVAPVLGPHRPGEVPDAHAAEAVPDALKAENVPVPDVELEQGHSDERRHVEGSSAVDRSAVEPAAVSALTLRRTGEPASVLDKKSGLLADPGVRAPVASQTPIQTRPPEASDRPQVREDFDGAAPGPRGGDAVTPRPPVAIHGPEPAPLMRPPAPARQDRPRPTHVLRGAAHARVPAPTADMRPPTVGTRRQTADTSPHTVHVTIGRLEVRTPAPPPPRAARPSARRPSLEAYLRSRRGGGAQ